jgi:hypothetical protein
MSGQFREIREEMRTLAPHGCSMLTFRTHSAGETGCDVVPGFEYSLFSYFPELSSHDALEKKVLNQELINARLRYVPPEVASAADQKALDPDDAGQGE